MLISPHTYVSTLTEIMVDGVELVCAACSNQVEKDDNFVQVVDLNFQSFVESVGKEK